MKFLLAVVLLVAVGKILSEVFERIGLVSMLGDFSAGLILGTSLLGVVTVQSVEQFAIIGVILLLFLAGYEETNTGFLFEERKRLSIISIVGLLITLAAMFLFAYSYFGFGLVSSVVFAFAFALTDIAVGAKALISTGKAGSRMGKSLLGLAVIDTILGIVMLAVSITLISTSSVIAIQKTLGGILLFCLIVYVGWRYLPKMISKARHLEAEAGQFSLALLTVFFLAYLAEELHLATVLGAYFGGLILQRSKALDSKEFNETVKRMAYGFFVPIFFGWMGLKTDLSVLPQYFYTAIIIAAVALGIKFTVTTGISLLKGTPLRESAVYGFGLIPKGADNLIVLAIGESLGILPGQTYEMMLVSLTLVIVVSIVISTTALNLLLDKT